MTVPFTLNGLTFNQRATVTQLLRTNLATTPRPDPAWTSYPAADDDSDPVGGTVSYVAASVPGAPQISTAWHVEGTGGAAGIYLLGSAGLTLPTTGPVSVSFWVRSSVSASAVIQADGTTVTSQSAVFPTWTLISGTVPSASSVVTVAFVASAGWVEATGLLVEQTLTVGSYFDGASPGRNWTGVPFSSTSQLTQVSPDVLAPFYTGTLPLGTAAARYASGARVQAHGQWSTTAYREALAFDVSGIVRLPSTVEIPAAIGELDAAFSLAPAPLTVHWPSGDQTIMVHRDGALDVQAVSDRVLTYGGQVVADDPTWYAGGAPVPIGPGYPLPPSGDVQSASTGLPSTSGGVSFPVSFPFAFDATVTSGDLSITTARGGWWVFTVAAIGPLVNPRIIVTDATGAQSLLAWTITMSAGESLIVDPQRRTSMLQGTASRPPSVRQWPSLPGGTTAVQFRADSGAGTLTVRYVSAA